MNVQGIMTGGDLLSQGAYGCVYHPVFKCKDYKNKKYTKLVAKIQGHGKSANNEEAIGKIVYNIPHSKDYFAPIVFRHRLFVKTLYYHISNQHLLPYF